VGLDASASPRFAARLQWGWREAPVLRAAEDELYRGSLRAYSPAARARALHRVRGVRRDWVREVRSPTISSALLPRTPY